MNRVLGMALLALLGIVCTWPYPDARAQVQREDLPWVFDTLARQTIRIDDPPMLWQLLDLNHDGTSELVLILDRYTVQVHLLDGRRWLVKQQYNLQGPGARHTYNRAGLIPDRNGDGWDELAVGRAEGDSLWIDVISGGAVVSTQPVSTSDRRKDDFYDARLVPVGVVDAPGPARLSTTQAIGATGDAGQAGQPFEALTIREPVASHEPLLIAFSVVGLDDGPRGVLAYSLETGEERWRHETGPNPTTATAHLTDLDGDGHRDILFTMSSPSNGRRAGLTDDAHAWVMALRGNGELLWLQRLGGYFHHPNWCEVLRPDGDRAYVVTGTDSRQPPVDNQGRERPAAAIRDTIHVWDAVTGRQTDALGWEEESLEGVFKLDERQLAVSTAEGLLAIYHVSPDGRLHATQLRKRTDPPVLLKMAADLDADGRFELVGVASGRRMHVVALTSDLELMADTELPPNTRGVALEPLARSEKRDLLMMSMGGQLLTLELLDNVRMGTPSITSLDAPEGTATERSGGAPRDPESGPFRTGSHGESGSPAGWLLPGFGLVGTAGAVILAITLARRRRRRQETGSAKEEARQPASPVPAPAGTGDVRRLRAALLMATEVGGHGQLAMTRVVRRFVWLLEAVDGQSPPSPESLARLREIARDFVDISSAQIEQVLALAAALQTDRTLINQLQQQAEALKAHIARLQAADWSAEAIAQVIEPARAARDQLESGLRQLHLFARRHLTQPLMREVERAVAAVAEREGATREGTSTEERAAAIPPITVDFDPDARDAYVRAARGDVAVIVENLLANAIRAVAGQPNPRVLVRGRMEPRFAVIEVTDNGCGIPPDARESVFEAGVSSRASGGTGLFASRRLLNDLGGSLRVKSSEVGRGTTMELRWLRETPPEDA